MLPLDLFAKPSGWRWLYFGGAAQLPFAISACFIVLTREWIIVDTIWDFRGFAVSLAAGVCCLWQLPIGRSACLMLTLIYLPVTGTFLFVFYLEFIGQRYNLWL